MADEKKALPGVEQGEGQTPASDFMASLPENAQAEVRKLRAEAARHRQNAKDFESDLYSVKKKLDEFEASKNKQAEEQGQFKELYEKTKGDLEKLSSLNERVKSYEDFFQTELDKTISGLTKEQQEIVEMSNVTVEKKLEIARRLSVNPVPVKPSKNSPASDRAGGTISADSEAVLKSIRDEKDMQKKARMTMELKQKDPELFNRL